MLDRHASGADTDHVFAEDDDMPPAVRALVDRVTPELKEDLFRHGFHIDMIVAGTATDQPDSTPMLVIDGKVGDLAFSDRVLRPTVVTDEEILADIDEATVTADYERLRAQLLEDE